MAEITRPPVVTILGHVDHGKTSLLDFIRKTTVAAGEHGGITQAIGAYQVSVQGTGDSGQKDKKDSLKTDDYNLITFIDTPGHAAFEKMRGRGAKVADIAVLVIAIDDGIMPQTIEAIKHIKAAKVPMIVAVNKIDLPGVNVKVQLEKIKKQLSDNEVLVEEYGGETPIVPLSAKTGVGVNDLLSTIILLSEIHELKGDQELAVLGVIIEARMDKARGPTATILIRDGSLNLGDPLISGETKGKVRGMFTWDGKSLEIAGPSTPVEVLGFESVPPVGATLGEGWIKKDQQKVLSLIEKLKQTTDEVMGLVIKADNQGSLEAILEMVEKFNSGKQHLKIIFAGLGEINDSDIQTAVSTKSIVLGFNVKIRPQAQKIAETEHILIRSYSVIYEMEEELGDVVSGMLVPGKVEEIFGRAQVIAEFPFGKDIRIAGCKVLEGVFSKGPKVRVVRGEEIIGETKIKSLKKAKEEVIKVEKGAECGMILEDSTLFQIGDFIESFRTF